MARDANVDAHRFSAFDDDRFGNHRDRLLRAAELCVRACCVQMLAIEILDVRGDVRGAPCDEAVAAEGDRRRAGQRCANDVEVAAGDVRQVPGGWQPGAEMRIVGEHRLAARRERAVHDPVVRAERFGRRAAEQEVTNGGLAVRQAPGERVGPQRGRVDRVGLVGRVGRVGLVGRIKRVGRVGRGRRVDPGGRRGTVVFPTRPI